MKLFLTGLLAFILLCGGVPPYSPADNGRDLVAYTEDANFTPGDLFDGCNDELIRESFALTPLTAILDPSSLVNLSSHAAPDRRSWDKNELGVLQLNSVLLI